MNKRLFVLVAPTAALAGALLLGACGSQQPAAPSQQDTSAAMKPASSTGNLLSSGDNLPGTGHQYAPKAKAGTNCGPVEYTKGGPKYNLITDDTSAGNPGCTVAFNILDEYLKAPVDPAGGSQGNKKLSQGWSCATDGGSGASATGMIACTTGKPNGSGGVTGGFAFHTERVR
ncbi:hypothetical protein LWC34_10485 [Kibdelosporangium philippinense]|uniref:Lipoprotein n=1 Tax=Kibdelosporangium philippinense TaxID=211113 RepID=A0ABS8Z5W9_9PSEU|nr:hypothetical protein [Kibdelosporangium philippinense]MCE7003255.1 hypothetical protein [Kibdelosporangium philippinense]